MGQHVVGYPSLGGYAEYAVAKVAEVAASARWCDCRASGGAADRLAHRMVRPQNRRRFESRRMAAWLHGGSSGVGVAAIQIAKHLGAKVIATSGSEVEVPPATLNSAPT